MMIQKTLRVCGFCVIFGLLMMAGSTMAQEMPQNLNSIMKKAFESNKSKAEVVRRNEISSSIRVPTSSSAVAKRNKGTLYLTPGKTQIITLEQDAASVVVGNSAYINVFLDTPRTAVVVPRAIGSTEFTILGKDGSVVAHSRVMISTETDNSYVRIHRVCGDASDCKQETVYYCEDNCVEVSSNTAQQR